jgi:hypothetical protein
MDAGDQFEVVTRRGCQHAADLAIGAAQFIEQRVALEILEGAERREVGRDRAEAVGLVPDATDQDALRHRQGLPRDASMPDRSAPPSRITSVP